MTFANAARTLVLCVSIAVAAETALANQAVAISAPADDTAAVAAPAAAGGGGGSPESLDAGFARGLKALEQGAFQKAVDEFELLADRGFVHPDLSFNRGAAYVGRAGSSHARPGDLGKAAAAFSEVLALRGDDEVAEAALDRVRNEIARRRAREGAEPVAARPSIGRAVVGLVSEGTWCVLAALGSALLTIGLALRLFSRRSPTRLAGAVAAALGVTLVALGGGLGVAADHLNHTSRPAVVVVSEARLLDENGVPVRQVDGVPEHVAIPEGAGVYVLERRGSLTRVEWGTTRAWVNGSQIRSLATP
jgi:hypothetical protein